MICLECRSGTHTGCRGGTWCPCQHRGAEVVVPEEVVVPSARATALAAEPPVTLASLRASRHWATDLQHPNHAG